MKKNKALVQLTEIDYISKLNDEEKEFLRKFEDEMYGGNSGKGEEPLMTTSEQIREDNRTHNQIYRDAFNVALNTKSLNYDNRGGHEAVARACDELEWEEVFSKLGPDKALELILHQCLKDIDGGLDRTVSLVRMLSKYERFKKTIRRSKRK